MERSTRSETVGLPGLDILMGTGQVLEAGMPFRPSAPLEEAQAQHLPSGLRTTLDEDVDGIEAPLPFRPVSACRAITAIDAGVVKLGEIPEGVVGAVRAAAVTHRPDGSRRLLTYRTGTIVLTSRNRLVVFHGMGRALGREDFYVEMKNGRPVAEKVHMGVHDHRLLDRARNFVERMVQRQVCSEVEDGIVVIDGALTLRTYDTPEIFLRGLENLCHGRRLSLVAVAKKTGLSIRGVDIRLLLDGEGGLPARRRLTRAVKMEASQRTRKNGTRASEHISHQQHRFLGDLYVARFAPRGETYRVDVDAEPGMLSADVLDEFAAGCLHRLGYPEPLIEAHLFSYMQSSVVAELQAHAVVLNRLLLKPEPNLGPVFAPFGGRYK
jgi:NurA domain-containing protein